VKCRCFEAAENDAIFMGPEAYRTSCLESPDVDVSVDVRRDQHDYPRSTPHGARWMMLVWPRNTTGRDRANPASIGRTIVQY